MKTLSIDTDGNRLFADKGNVYLSLVNERCRKVATIDKENKILIMEREQRHLLRKADAYGFNYELLTKVPSEYKIELHCPDGVFRIAVTKVLEQGSFLHFKSQSFERQLFLTREQIKE